MFQDLRDINPGKHTMKKKLEVSAPLVSRIFSKVSFKDRFIGGRLRQHAGVVKVTSYSFEEVIHLLNDQTPMINFKALEKWLREVIMDEDLADKVAGALDEKGSYLNTLCHIKGLMEDRLRQCKKQGRGEGI
jgi:hypothetical protein